MLTSYDTAAAERLAALRNKKGAAVLAVETSCDETAAAVVLGGRTVRSNVVHTQIPLHRRFGGVVPEIASRNHVEAVGPVVRQALDDAKLTLPDIDAVAVTNGPGLVGALLVGVSFAKGLAAARDLPLVGTNHIAAHIAANYLTYPDLAPPFCCLIASGGHSHIVSVDDYDRFTLLGRTRDDAAGEALDKVARLLGLGYPGGPIIDKLSRGRVADPRAFPEGRVREGVETGGLRSDLCLSFSGLKTALLHRVTAQPPADDDAVAQLAADYQEAVVQALVKRCDKALGDAKYLAVGGGVSLNSRLRVCLAELCARRGVRLLLALPKHCGDNAAMIAALAAMGRGITSPESFALDIAPSWAV